MLAQGWEGEQEKEERERKWPVIKETWTEVRVHQGCHYASKLEILSEVNQIPAPPEMRLRCNEVHLSSWVSHLLLPYLLVL